MFFLRNLFAGATAVFAVTAVASIFGALFSISVGLWLTYPLSAEPFIFFFLKVFLSAFVLALFSFVAFGLLDGGQSL